MTRLFPHFWRKRLETQVEILPVDCYLRLKPMASATSLCVRTLRLKVKREGYAWLNAAAVEVNQVWNWANATSYKAARPFAGPSVWLSGYDLDKLSAGASQYFEHIGSETIQRINAEFATRRRQFKKLKLRWRVSRGPNEHWGGSLFCGERSKRTLSFFGNLKLAHAAWLWAL